MPKMSAEWPGRSPETIADCIAKGMHEARRTVMDQFAGWFSEFIYRDGETLRSIDELLPDEKSIAGKWLDFFERFARSLTMCYIEQVGKILDVDLFEILYEDA